MKQFYVIIFLGLIVSGCLGYKELPVEYDYSYSGRFKKYNTFDLLRQPTSNRDTTMYNPIIESSILSRMKFLGYRQTERKPNLLVAYKIYYDSLNFNGYEQPEIEEWIEQSLLEGDDEYKEKKISMRTGTLLIQLYDRRQEKLIWNGYATSLYGPISYNNKRQLRNAVISILDKYRFFADGYMESVEETQ